nr:serine/threonine protein kinase [Deltaproteobacteria bacterium]
MLSPQPVMKRVGRFLLLQQIDHGGLGMVYAAYDEQLDRKVAVKVTREDHILDDEQRLRFHREAQALAQLSDPNVVTVHEVGESDGRVFVAMEYVHGISFSAWLTTEPGWRAVLEAFVLAGLGLKAAHDAELVHGRFEPANIIRGDDGTVKVLGFGLGR